MDSHTYDHLERQAHFNRAYIGQQLQVPSSLKWATNGKQLQRARKLQVIIWFLTLTRDSLVSKYDMYIWVRKLKATGVEYLGGSFVTLVAYIINIKKIFTALMDLTDMWLFYITVPFQ